MRLSARAVIFGSGNRGGGGQREIVIPSMSTIRNIATDETGIWVVVGTGAAYSSDKINWTKSASTFLAILNNVATDRSGNWVAYDNSNNIYHSNDNGVTWTQRTDLGYTSFQTITYHQSVDKFYITNSNREHMVSTDGGLTWSDLVIPNNVYGQAAGSISRVVISGNNGNNKYTDDGVTWLTAGQPLASMRSGSYGNGTFVFSDSSANLYYSLTGSGAWTLVNLSGNELTEIFWLPSESRWVSSDTAGIWYESTDLTTWTEILLGDFFGLSYAVSSATDLLGYGIVLSGDKLYIGGTNV